MAENNYLPTDAPEESKTNWGELRRYHEIPQTGPIVNREQARSLVHGYYASVSFVDALVGRFLDIYPTLCSLIGIDTPSHCAARDLSPLLTDKPAPKDLRSAVFSRHGKGESMKTDRYRYTEFIDKDGETISRMLYDHKVDPAENTKISDQPKYRTFVSKLSKQLHAHLDERD